MEKIVKKTEDGCLLLELDKEIYSKEAITSAAYKFTNRCYIHVTSTPNSEIIVHFKMKDKNTSGEKTVDEFCNELIDEQLRIDIKRDTKQIREMIVKKAFFPFEKE